MSWEEDYLMKKVGELEERLTTLEDGARVDVQEPIAVLDQPEEGTDYSAYTVKELVAEIERRNEADGKDLPTTGNKGDLVARLVEDDEADAEEE